MADKSELEIAIGADGRVRIVTHGLRGQTCLVETKELEQALGRVTNREKTREFYQQDERASDRLRNR